MQLPSTSSKTPQHPQRVVTRSCCYCQTHQPCTPSPQGGCPACPLKHHPPHPIPPCCLRTSFHVLLLLALRAASTASWNLCSRTRVLARRPQLGMWANRMRAASNRPSSKHLRGNGTTHTHRAQAEQCVWMRGDGTQGTVHRHNNVWIHVRTASFAALAAFTAARLTTTSSHTNASPDMQGTGGSLHFTPCHHVH